MRCTVDGGLMEGRAYISPSGNVGRPQGVGRLSVSTGGWVDAFVPQVLWPNHRVSPTLGCQQIFDEFHKYWQCACQIQNINHSSFRFSSVFIYMPEEKQAKMNTPTPAVAATTTTTNSSRHNCCVRVFSLATQTKNDERHRQLVFSFFRIILRFFFCFFMCRLFGAWAWVFSILSSASVLKQIIWKLK